MADVAVSATVFTDPYCPWSWAAEPQLRRLQVEFGDQLAYTFVIVGLRRTIDTEAARALALAALDAAAESGMPVDPRVFLRDPPALLDAARETRGLDVDRLRVDFGSNAIVERLGADIERGRGLTTPTVEFAGGERVAGTGPYERLRAAALAAGAQPAGDGFPGVEEALRRFGTLATAEAAAVCDLPGPRAPAELWRLALEWRVTPRRAGGGELWVLA